MKRFALAIGFAFACLTVFACGDSGDGPTCEQIGETCHDVQTDLGQECHEFGEDPATTEEECQERSDCVEECNITIE